MKKSYPIILQTIPDGIQWGAEPLLGNTIGPEAKTTTILRKTSKPCTKRKPSGNVVSFKLPIENEKEPTADRPKDILTSAPPMLLAPTADDNTNDDGNTSVDSFDMGSDDGCAASAITEQPEVINAIVMEIDNVPVHFFVNKQSAHVPVAPLYIDETHRQFANPISYLGGPQLRPRNRNSIESILSLD